MSHLGRWLSALVDGELDPAERDRVLSHLAGCPACLAEVSAMRALKRRLTALGGTAADDAIAGKLIELARTDHGHETRTFRGVPWPSGRARMRVPGIRHVRPGQPRLARRRRSAAGQAWRVTAGSAGTAVLAVGVAAFVLGNSAATPPGPKVTPSVDSYVLQHAYDAGQEPALPGSGTSLLPASPGLAGPGRVDPWRLGAVHVAPLLRRPAVKAAAVAPGRPAARARTGHMKRRRAR